MKLLSLHHDNAIKYTHSLNLKKINKILCVTHIKVTIKKFLFLKDLINFEFK